MKKKISVIAGIVAAAALTVVAVILTPNNQGELTDQASRRSDAPIDDGVVVIEPELTALAGELSGSAETKAAAKAAFDQINAQRQSSGLGALTWSNGLEQASAVRAVEASQVWSHDRPDGSEYWTVNSSIVYGENLAKGYSSADGAFAGWMASPTHKDNIMFSGFKTGAIAIHVVNGQWYWANEFGY
ncbi:MAG: CAP domain-containing protein [Lachnospiraceae bacterium]|nr:CAP domain-containing protein [Lachnospiraceae bacterium]